VQKIQLQEKIFFLKISSSFSETFNPFRKIKPTEILGGGYLKITLTFDQANLFYKENKS